MMPEKVRVFIGDGPEMVRKVIECSIIRRTETRVDFIPMIGPEWEQHDQPRWLIPSNTNYTGRAVYIDQNCLLTTDVWDLWTKPEQCGDRNESYAWCAYPTDKQNVPLPLPDTNVMLLNCHNAKRHWGFDPAAANKHMEENFHDFTSFMQGAWLEPPATNIGSWHLQDPKTKTARMYNFGHAPPWLDTEHPQAMIWRLELSIAVNCNMITEEMIRRAVEMRAVDEDMLRFLPTKKKRATAATKHDRRKMTIDRKNEDGDHGYYDQLFKRKK